MRMLVITYSGGSPDRISDLLDAEGVLGHTRIPGARGHGLTGPREGTRAWPGETTIFFTVVPSEQSTAVCTTLRAHTGTLPAGERLHVAVLPTETFF